MSKRVRRFPSFSNNNLASPKMRICAHALAWPYPSDSNKATFVSHTITTHAYQLAATTLPAHLLPSPARSPLYFSLCHSYQYSLRLNQLLVFCFTIVVSSYSNSYELMTAIIVFIF
ncbi:unnamed protein product [Hymenolepis diminuta]|uniref:Uncharacterized protein n=1 Tax=Hymenolepis diminuta TaxID=6216 RepID=A0A564ZA72_HYMDI|nr:unnamed protein product [Hymenolepis diminuta]